MTYYSKQSIDAQEIYVDTMFPTNDATILHANLKVVCKLGTERIPADKKMHQIMATVLNILHRNGIPTDRQIQVIVSYLKGMEGAGLVNEFQMRIFNIQQGKGHEYEKLTLDERVQNLERTVQILMQKINLLTNTKK